MKALTGDVGLDVILALDLSLAPSERLIDASDLDAACVALERPRPKSLLRSLLKALAFSGRLVTTSGSLELSGHEAQHLHRKGCSVSFWNPQAVAFGQLLHAAAEVCGRLPQLPLAPVRAVELFEAFEEALKHQGLVVLVV